jgi:CRISPR-associated protein Cas5d
MKGESKLENENSVSFQVSGKMALFSDPVTRVGGEKCSYQVPTYQALKGILESVYWKPTFIWHIDAVRVMNSITSRSEGIRPIGYSGGNTLSIYTYLTDVKYEVKAHFEWNKNRPDLANDRNENKHYFIAKRMIERGGRRDVFLGTRECQAYVEPCEFGKETGHFDSLPELSFGLMFHGFNYPDEIGQDRMEARLWYPKMRNGVIEFCRPEDCPVVRVIKKQKPKAFCEGNNFNRCDSLAEEVGYRGMDAKTV